VSIGSFFYKTSQGPFVDPKQTSQDFISRKLFSKLCFTLILQNYHLRLDLGSKLCPYALSPVIMVTVIISFRLLCVFPSLTLQLITPHSWSIQVPG